MKIVCIALIVVLTTVFVAGQGSVGPILMDQFQTVISTSILKKVQEERGHKYKLEKINSGRWIGKTLFVEFNFTLTRDTNLKPNLPDLICISRVPAQNGNMLIIKNKFFTNNSFQYSVQVANLLNAKKNNQCKK